MMATRTKPKAKQKLALDVYSNLTRAEISVSGKGTEILEGTGLTLGQFSILETLHSTGSMIQTEIATKHLSSRANITKLLHKLEEKKLVTRVPDGADRRKILVKLTKKGKSLVTPILPKLGAKMAESLSVLTNAEQKTLANLLKKLEPSENGHHK